MLKTEFFALHTSENKQSSMRSSGGVIVYIRSDFVTEDTLVFESCDDIICVKNIKTVLGLSDDIFVCLCYIIPENSSRQA